MNKSVKWVLSAVIGISVFLFATTMPLAAVGSDDEVGVAIEFEKAEYFPGETAKAHLKISGIADEAHAGYKLGALETGIKFDASKLAFKAAEFKVVSENSSDCSIALDADETNPDLIVALFYSGAGVEFTPQADGGDGSFVLAEIEFKVLETASGEAAVGFDDIYESMFVLPKSLDYAELACTMAKDAKMSITGYEYIMESGGAKAFDTKITDSITVRVKDEVTPNALLIAGVYEKDEKLLLSQVVMKQVSADEQSYDISFEKPVVPDGTQLEVRYYLWNSTASLSPLAPGKTVAVN